MNRFSQKVALVTGAASGIGKATAIRLASEGAKLIVADLNMNGLLELKSELSGTEVHVLQFDATDANSCRTMAEDGARHFGQLDVLCNIAGIAGAWRLADMTDQSWDLMMTINLTSIFQITQTAMPYLVKSKGNVINMSSVSGLQGQPYNSCYGAVKAGVIGFTKSIAAEFCAEGVRVNAICPGGVKTPIYDNYSFPEDANPVLVDRMFPLPGFELSEPCEIAAMVAYLASDEARFTTGTTMINDGGQTCL